MEAPKIKITTSLIRAITQSTYHNVSSQIREFVANSIDAKANRFNIFSLNNAVAFVDDGNGLTKNEFENEYLTIGYSQSYKNNQKNGRFGIGMLSALPSCNTFYVYSKTKTEHFLAKINSSKLFKDDNRKNKVEDEFEISYNTLEDEKEIKEYIQSIETYLNLSSKTHAVFILSKPKGKMAELTSEKWYENNSTIHKHIEKLRYELPLPIDKNDSFLNQLSDTDANEIKKIFDNTEYSNIELNWYVSSDDGFSTVSKQITHFLYGNNDTKNNPIENYEVIPWQEYQLGENDKIYFGGYFIFNTKLVKMEWRNPIIRLNNIMVCRINELSGSREFIGTYPYSGHYSGEIVVVGLKDILKITRDAFDDTSELYQSFIKLLSDTLNKSLKTNRERYKLKKEAKSFFVDEQNKIPIYIKNAIDDTIDIWKKNELDDIEIIKKFKSISESSILNKRNNLDEELRDKIGKKIQLYDKEDEGINTRYFISPAKDINEPSVEQIDNAKNKDIDLIVKVNPDFFKPKEINLRVLGKFQIETKHGKKKDPPFDVNINEKKVYINFFNSDLTKYNLSVFEVETIIKAAAVDTGNSKDELVEEISQRLRKKYLRQNSKGINLVASFVEFPDDF